MFFVNEIIILYVKFIVSFNQISIYCFSSFGEIQLKRLILTSENVLLQKSLKKK